MGFIKEYRRLRKENEELKKYASYYKENENIKEKLYNRDILLKHIAYKCDQYCRTNWLGNPTKGFRKIEKLARTFEEFNTEEMINNHIPRID